MRIQEIYMGHFGAITDRRVGPFGPGLTLVRGNNEEGKTTLLELVRGVLFGFRERAARNLYLPPHGGGRMGALEVEGDDGSRWRVERSEGPRGGRVKILNAQGAECSPETLMDLLHRTERHLFESVFAFGLQELQEIESLHSAEVQGRIMGAAAGTGSVSPVDVWRRLTEQSRGLFKPTGKTQPVGRALKVLGEVETEIEKIRTLPAHYAELSRQLRQACQNREDARNELASAQKEFTRCQKLVDLEATWREFLQVDAQAQELGPAALFPPDGIRRLEKSLELILSAREGVEKLESRIRSAQEELNRSLPHHELIAFRQDIDALTRRAMALDGFPDELRKAQAKEAVERDSTEAALNALRDKWDEKRALQFDTSASAEQMVIEWEARLREAHEDLRRRRERFELAAAASRHKERALEDARKALDHEVLSLDPLAQPAAKDRLEEWLRFNERAQADGDRVQELKRELDEAVHYKDELTAQAEKSSRTPEAAVPGWLPPAAAAVLIGVAMLVAAAGSMLIAVLLAAIGFAGGLWLSRFRRQLLDNSRRRYEEEQSQLGLLHQRIERRIRSLQEKLHAASESKSAAERQMASISKEVVGRDGLTEQEARSGLARARAADEQVRRIHALQLQVQQLQRELDRAKEDESRCREELQRSDESSQKTQETWASWRKERGLELEGSPEALRVLFQGVREFQQAHWHWEESRKAVEQSQAHWEDFHQQSASLLAACRRDVPGSFDLLGAIQGLKEDCQEAQDSFRRRSEIEQRIQEELNQLESARKKLRQEENERAALLADSRAKDERSFRALEPLARRRHELLARRRELLASLMVGAEEPTEESLRRALQAVNWGEIRLQEEKLAADVARLRKMIDSLGETIGSLNNEIRSLEQSDSLSLLLQQREQALAQLQESSWEWATTAAAASLLDLARKKYETQRQPMVIRWAAEIFRQMTGGLFIDVRIPLDEPHPKALRATGELVPVEHLSRGTAEQLYLAIRLALIREFVRQAGPLPVLMDDILVNFDHLRGLAGAHAIAEFSRSTPLQVIFFTCHPHVLQHFQEIQDRPTVLDLARFL